jgi:NAD(P)-dependent dehydrogenase (short-subunit alcohol dehydrogenase family)
MHNFNKKSVLITGGTSGIGYELAKSFIAAKAKCTISGRRAEGAELAQGIGAGFVPCDVSKEPDVKKALQEAGQNEPLDVLILNAGIAVESESLADLSLADFEQLLATNTVGVFLFLKHAADYMSDGGSIVVTGSVLGSGMTIPGEGGYAASKAAAAYLMRTAALELAPRNIRVNAVCPAVISGTGMMVADDGNDDARFLASLTAFDRMGRISEAVEAFMFLASDKASFITGQELSVDGGMNAGLGLPILDGVGRRL